ncbi:MAG: hypothetical protein ACKVGZ_21480 [Alphaproteobacteria bacterium]|jgi:DNA-binding NarL/FixJ family response regulator
MSAQRDRTIQLYILTGDDFLASTFVEGLREQGLNNVVQRIQNGSQLLDDPITQNSLAPRLVVLDMRGSKTESRSFLNDVQRQTGRQPPIVIAVVDEEDDAEALAPHKQFVAGQISSKAPAAEFIELVNTQFAANWAVKPD